jgi:hypothetical protein
MKNLVRFALAALFLLGSASAQNIPPIDVFGGYSYLSFDFPANPSSGTTSQRLALNGYDFSVSVRLLHQLAVEADISGHSLNDCDNTTFNCTDFSYMFGPRFNLRDRSRRITGFVHALVGRDNGTLSYNGSSLTDTSIAFAGGAGVDYWFFRHIGVQLGPVDYMYTRHLNDFGLPSQNNIRISAGVVFRFGGELPSGEHAPKAQPAPSEGQSTSKSKRGSSAGPPPAGGVQQPAPLPVSIPGHGMPITSLGVVVAPQEFDGAKIVEIVSGGVAEMASLKAGDLIKSVDGKAVRTPMELAAELSDKSGKVRIGILRGTFATETLVLISH